MFDEGVLKIFVEEEFRVFMFGVGKVRVHCLQIRLLVRLISSSKLRWCSEEGSEGCVGYYEG